MTSETRQLLAAIKPYLALLKGKAGTSWCMHDRGIYEVDAVEAWDRLEAAITKAEGREP